MNLQIAYTNMYMHILQFNKFFFKNMLQYLQTCDRFIQKVDMEVKDDNPIREGIEKNPDR
jgi:hypothetical protein